jgi:Kef-type K+ transport system membrane component KefB
MEKDMHSSRDALRLPISNGARYARWILLALPLLPLLLASSSEGGEGGGHSVILNIALAMVAASLLGLIMKVLKQPAMLGYILAGVAIGPIGIGMITDHTEIVTISEIGLILLLFMIGLEIDLKKMLAAGRLVIVPGVLQFPICVAMGWAILKGLTLFGLSFGEGNYALLYTAIAISISSTMIVVKLLYDKMELDTLPGRITVGILVFQDIWAIIVLAIQPNLADPKILSILLTFAKGGLLVALALAISRWVLPVIFHVVAKIPELLLVLSLGWCFLVALVAAHPFVGLSMEMGALIAGVSLATFPYNLDVIAKVVSIRDFFITLFFVALGMQIPMPTPSVLLVSLVIVFVALVIRAFGVFAVLQTLRAGHRTSLLPTINLSQVSEFALVIVAIGIGYEHVSQESLTYIIWVFSVLAVASTYLVTYSHPLQDFWRRLLLKLGVKDIGKALEDEHRHKEHPILILGFFRIASAFMDEVFRKHQDLIEQIKVVDFNPVVRKKLEKMGVYCVYGDISNIDTLHHAHVEGAKVVLCSVPDSILKGTTNKNLLSLVRSLCPEAQVILTAESPSQAAELYKAGADFVIQVSAIAGAGAAIAVEQALSGTLEALREEQAAELGARNEVLA